MDLDEEKICPECRHRMKLKDDSVGEIYYECLRCGFIFVPESPLSPRSSLESFYKESLDYVETEAAISNFDDSLDEPIHKKRFVVSSKIQNTETSINFSTSRKSGMCFQNLNNAKDILGLHANDLINKSSLYNIIVESKEPFSHAYLGREFEIKNSPQQGINWIGDDLVPKAVIVKSKFGHYHQDGINEYAFKARNGIVNKYEKANLVLINQPKFNYPIFYFVEYGDMWKLLGLFKVDKIKTRSVTLLPFDAITSEKEKSASSPDTASKKEVKKIIQSITAQRSVSLVNGKCKFVLKDGSYILADDNGKENSDLPWSGVDVKLNIFQIENDIVSDWNWEKLD